MSDTVYYCTILNSNNNTIENFEEDNETVPIDSVQGETSYNSISGDGTQIGSGDTNIPVISESSTSAPVISESATNAPVVQSTTEPVIDGKEPWISGFTNKEIILSLGLLCLIILFVILY